MFKKNSLMIKIMVLFFLVFFGAYIPLTQRIPYLSSIGYSTTEMNLIFSLQAAIAFSYQLVLGFLCDKYKTIKKFFLASQVIGTVGVYMMFAQTGHVFWFHILAIAVIGSLGSVAIGLLDAWALEIDPVIQENYGAVRGMGTVGWIIGGYLVTWIIDYKGFEALGLTYAIIAIALFTLGFSLKDAVKVKHDKPITLMDMKALLFNKRYLMMVVILFFAMMLSNSDGLIVVMKMEALGATAMEKYLRFALQAMVELPALFLGGKLLKKFKAIHVLSFAIVMYAIRFITYSFADTPTLMIGAAMLQAVTFPLLMITSKRLVFGESPEHLKSSGQMVAVSIYSGIGAALTPLITAFLIEMGGIDFSFVVFASFMIIPLGLIMIYNRAHA